jgi:ATP-dependent Clp protease protease subunit
MIGHIYINKQIGSFEGIQGIELIDLITQVQKQKDAEMFFVYVNSPGGRIDVGDDMYTYLKSLPQRITTVGIGMVASIATKPFLSGDERYMIIGESELMVHNPWVDNVRGDAEDLLSAAEEIRKEEDRLIDFYSESTGISREGLDALMKSETYLTPEKALELGFITKVITRQEATSLGMIFPNEHVAKLKALAFKKTDTMSKEILSKIDQVLAFFKKEEKPEAKKLALMVSDSNGVQVEIKKADGTEIEGKPAQGDLVTVEGKPGEGSYILPDMGITIEVKAGVISSITDTKKKEESKPEAPTQDAELAEAKAKIKELEAQAKEHETFKAEVEAKFALIEKSLKSTVSNYQVLGKSTEFREEKNDSKGLVTKEELKKRKDQRNTKTK